MKTVTAVFSSNSVNRYGMIMPVPVLESCLNQAWKRPLPASIGHDIHRARGWNSTIALHLQPTLARVFGTVNYAENSKDIELVQHVVDEAIAHRVSELEKTKVDELRKRLAEQLSPNAQLHAQGCAAFYDVGLASRVFSSLFASRDKDGLVPLRELNCVAPGIFEKDGLLLFAHQFFRRSLSRFNTLNDPFLARLEASAKDNNLDIRIALDADLVGHPTTILKNIELQYWWGPHFSDKLDEIHFGVTRHEASQSECFFNAISATEFWWYEQDGRKTFECEEIRDLDVPSMGQSGAHFGCRFIHSILDTSHCQSIHLDGAVRLYTEDLMLERVEKDILHFGRRAEYTKLWRIDGLLPVDAWKALINDYYRDNHLVGEYFGGKEENEEFSRPSAIKIDEACSIHEFAPCTMARGDGVRIAISYHTQNENTFERVIVPMERYNKGEGWVHYVEACTIEIVKLVRRRGEAVEFPEGVPVIAFEDMVTNLPLIEHCGSDSIHQAQITLEVIRDYCLALQHGRNDRMIAFHISSRFQDRDVYFSFAGHIDDMIVWLQSGLAILPQSIETIGRWTDKIYEFLTATFPKARDIPPLENMIKTSGLLTVDRKFLLPGEFIIQHSKQQLPVISLVRCPTIEKALPLVKEKGLVVAMAFIIKESECQKCHKSYNTCSCIKMIDAGVGQYITDAVPFGVFWTDRSARSATPVRELPEG